MAGGSTPFSGRIDVANVNEARIDALGSNTYTGQTFQALTGFAQGLKLYLGWQPVSLRLLVTEVDDSSGSVKPGAVLFETAAFRTPDSQTPALQEYKFALGGLDLVAGTKYAFILDSVTDRAANTFGDKGQIGVTSIFSGDVYTAGVQISNDQGATVTGTRADHFAQGFGQVAAPDIAFTMDFSATAPGSFNGTGAGEKIIGGNRSATVYAAGGDDLVVGGGKDDNLNGQLGNDTIRGGGGYDRLDGGNGNDSVTGGNGRDRVYLGAGDDRFFDNKQAGTHGQDLVFGGAGKDRLNGGGGKDEFRGGDGNDTVKGGAGNDRLFGDAGHDRLFGGDGADTVRGGNGRDRAELGAGNDVFIDTGQNDANGRDTVLGGAGRDTIKGGGGNDSFFGNGGDDILRGGLGNDRLDGGPGRDVLTGGPGGDSFVFRSGRDVVTDFGTGNDWLRLDDALWGNKTPGIGKVLSFAEIVGNDTLFDFGGSNTLRLVDYTDIPGLADDVFVF